MEAFIKRLKDLVDEAASDLTMLDDGKYLRGDEVPNLRKAWSDFEEAWALEQAKRDRHESGCVARVTGQANSDDFTCAWLKDGTKIVLHYIAGGTAVGMRHIPSAIIKVQDADSGSKDPAQ